MKSGRRAPRSRRQDPGNDSAAPSSIQDFYPLLIAPVRELARLSNLQISDFLCDSLWQWMQTSKASGKFQVVTKRLFIGLELPASSRELLARLDPEIKGLRWLPVGQFHLTMSFLGAVDLEKAERLQEKLTNVRVPPFFLPITGVGAFGGARPTIVWAGVGRGHPHLFALHQHIQDAVLGAGLEADLKPFHPHITLGRSKNMSLTELLPFLRRYSETEFDLWQVTGFALFSSLLSVEGATHKVEMRREF